MTKFYEFNNKTYELPDEATEDQLHEFILGSSPEKDKNITPSITDQINQYNELTGSNRTPVDAIRDLTQGVLTGLGKGGQFLNQSMMKIPGAQQFANSVRQSGPSLAEVLTKSGPINPEQPNMDEFFSSVGSPNKSIGGNVIKGIGEYAPYGAMGGPSLLGQMGAGALYGASTASPDENNLFGILPNGKLGSSIESALLNALTHGAFKGVQALRPSKLLRGNLSKEELAQNLEAAAGTQTNLGDVIGSPMIKRQYENILSKIPFSGANEKLQQTGAQIIDRGNSIIEGLSGGKPKDTITDEINSDLIDAHAKHQIKKNIHYYDFNHAADNSRINLELPTFSSLAHSYADAIESTNILKTEPDIRNLFNKLQNYKNPVKETKGSIVSTSGKPLTTNKEYPSFKEANLLKAKLNEYAHSYNNSINPSERNLASVFSNLSKAIKTDIRSSLKEKPSILNKYDNAEKNYKENYSQFLDKDIYPFIKGSKDSDTIVQKFINTSRSADRANQITKISKLLPDGSNKLAYSYFARALDNEGNLNPAKLNTLYKNLGRNQLKALIPDENIRKQLGQYSKLYGMNTKAVNMMQNPATGQQNLDVLPAMLTHAASAGVGGSLGGIPGFLTGLVAPGFATKGIVKWLTSPQVRKNLVKEMIDPKEWNKNISTAIQTAIQGADNR